MLPGPLFDLLLLTEEERFVKEGAPLLVLLLVPVLDLLFRMDEPKLFKDPSYPVLDEDNPLFFLPFLPPCNRSNKDDVKRTNVVER